MSSRELVAAIEIFIRAVVQDMSPDADSRDSVHLFDCRDLLTSAIDKEFDKNE